LSLPKPNEEAPMREKYLVAVDGSEHARKAVDLATELAKASDADLILVHVIRFEPMPTGLNEFAEAENIPIEELRGQYLFSKSTGDVITGAAAARVREHGLDRVTTLVAEGNPANEIVALAEAEGAAMIFLGSRGVSDVRGLVMGSVSHKVMHLAPCTCVAVR